MLMTTFKWLPSSSVLSKVLRGAATAAVFAFLLSMSPSVSHASPPNAPAGTPSVSPSIQDNDGPEITVSCGLEGQNPIAFRQFGRPQIDDAAIVPRTSIGNDEKFRIEVEIKNNTDKTYHNVYALVQVRNKARGIGLDEPIRLPSEDSSSDIKKNASTTLHLGYFFTAFPGSGWEIECEARKDVRWWQIDPFDPSTWDTSDPVVSTDKTRFTIGDNSGTGLELMFNSCTVDDRDSDFNFTFKANSASRKNSFARFDKLSGKVEFYKNGNEILTENLNIGVTGIKSQFQNSLSIDKSGFQDDGLYTYYCVLYAQNPYDERSKKLTLVDYCTDSLIFPHKVLKVACLALLLAVDAAVGDAFQYPVAIKSGTICVGDESDCPGTSPSTGTTTTTPPTEGTAAETVPVAPVPPPAPEPPGSSDRAALTALYNSTSGARWINTLQERQIWQVDDSGSDLDDWYGVETHDNGRVKYLLLEFDNNLHGTLPPRLGNLTESLVLSIKGNERDGRSLLGVRGSIPGELGNLTALQELYLSGNELTGGIPEALGNLSELDALDLSDNRLSGNIPAALGNLTLLRDLDLSGNRLEGDIPAALAKLTDLESLYLSGGSNTFTGCIPSGLRRVDDHDLDDLDDLGIPFCDVALSGLTVSPGQLDEPFDSTQTSFSATVYQSRITVVPAAVESGSFDILDDGGNLIADADAVASGHQVDLSSDDETIRVRITSGSGRNSETYTLDITVEGPSVPGAPTIGAVTAQGASLLVPWSAAAGPGASAATSYNLRHIRTDASDKADANWTPSTVSASPGSSAVSYWLQDLEAQTAYDLQVRAVNDAGSSPWSASVSATTSAVIRISWITCVPARPLPGVSVSCTPTVTGGVRSDDSYAWLAEGGSPSGGSGSTFDTFWDSMGPKSVAVEACSAGDCASSQQTVNVADPNPSFVWDYPRLPAEIALGDSVDLQFGITRLGVAGEPGGISVSFPTLTQHGTTGSPSSYESGQGTVETISFSGASSGVTYHDSSSRQGLPNADGTQGTPHHLSVSAEISRWPLRSWFFPPAQSLNLRATPGETGEFRILYRFWLCTDDEQNCVHRPSQDGANLPATDQQGWAAFELTVNVLAPPVIDSISCTPAPAQASDTVDCSPVLSGSAPSTYAWNAGNALAGGSPYEGTGPTFSTAWDYPGRHRVGLEVCNVAGCATGETFVTVRGDTADAEPVQLPAALAGEDGGRVLYSGPASGKSHSQYSPTDTVLLVKILPTSPVPTLQITIYDGDGFASGSASYVSPGVVVLALPEDAWVDYARIATEMHLSGFWAPYTKQTEAVLLAVQSALSAADLAASTTLGLAPAVGMVPGPALTASDHLSLGLGGVSDPPVNEIFGETHANCVSQVTIPWLAWAEQATGVRVSIPLSMSREAYASLAAAFTAAEPDATGGNEPALAQLHDLLATGESSPECMTPELEAE